MEMNRIEILQKIESGELSVEAGFKLLNDLDNENPPQLETGRFESVNELPQETVEPPLVGEPIKDGFHSSRIPDFKKFRGWSWVMFSIFILLTAISAWWMVSAWQNRPFGFGFWMSWIPFGIGVLGMATSFNARWLHVRVSERKNGEWKNINISMPLPLGIASWVLKANPGWLPSEMRDKNIGETLTEINQSITHDQPFYVEVDEDDQHVEVYIG